MHSVIDKSLEPPATNIVNYIISYLNKRIDTYLMLMAPCACITIILQSNLPVKDIFGIPLKVSFRPRVPLTEVVMILL